MIRILFIICSIQSVQSVQLDHRNQGIKSQPLFTAEHISISMLYLGLLAIFFDTAGGAILDTPLNPHHPKI